TMEGKHGSVYGHTEVPRTPPCARPSARVGPVYDATAQGQGLLSRYRRELLTCGRRRLMTTSCGVAKPCCCRGTEEHEPPVGLEAGGIEVAVRPSVALREEARRSKVDFGGKRVGYVTEIEVTENAVEIGHVYVGDPGIAADEQHILVILQQRVG